MSIPEKVSYQLPIFPYDCRNECEIYAACGGSETAPCGCIYKGTARAYRCSTCHLTCRDWRGSHNEFPSKAWWHELEQGRRIEAIHPNDISPPPLPLLIPTLTDRLQSAVRLPVSWFGVQLESLINIRKDGSGSIKGWVEKEDLARFQRVTGTAEPIGILHGDDPVLEAFWGLPFDQVCLMLRVLGVRITTSPTFSVYGDGDKWPACQSVMMMYRHNRYVHELSRAGFIVAPNLYWRRKEEFYEWLEWLQHHRKVVLVSRDFSMTKQGAEWQEEFKNLVELMHLVGRPMHILLLGVGEAKAADAIASLADIGSTCSIISGQPTMLAQGGEKISEVSSGRDAERSLDRGALAVLNYDAFEERLVTLSTTLPEYDGHPVRNLRAA